MSLDEAVIARLDRDGERFEILVDPEMAHDLKEGDVKPEISEIVAVEEVFLDAHKGDRAPVDLLQKVFGTSKTIEIIEIIIKKGEIQLTTEQRKKMQEEKRKQIVALLSRNCINPVNKTPHPPLRLEMAMEEAKINVDPFKPAEIQMNDVLKGLRPILPIRMEMAQIAVKTTSDHYGKLVGEIRSYGKVLKEEWNKAGEWMCLVEIPAGLQIEFFDMVNSRTHGDAETKLID
ncbi:MAG: ribosome assembly factor SBDS [Candidatus Thermoplasmatota archaeon]|nr:ribosome assembly factor SBDS [Candidatus Thermoplasmatota archaeon]